MSAAPFPVAAVMSRLRSKVPGLREIGTSADLKTAIESQPRATPAAFVLAEERGHPPVGASGGVLIQTVDVVVQVVLIVRNFARNETGSEARAEMDALASNVDAALLNWSVPGCKPLSFVAGRDERFVAGSLTHQRVFRSDRSIRIHRNP